MKLFSLVAVLMMFVVAGCSNAPSKYSRAKGAQETKIETDYEYVELVHRATRDRGIQVEWVNPPVKRVPVKQEKTGE